MPAEIKAKLELITGGSPAAAGGAPASSGTAAVARKEDTIMKNVGSRMDALTRVLDRRLESFTDIKNSMKDMVAIFRKPGFGKGTGIGDVGAAIATAVGLAVTGFLGGYGAAYIGDNIGAAAGKAASEVVYDYIEDQKTILPILNAVGIYAKEQLIDTSTMPASNPDLQIGGKGMGTYYDQIEAIKQIESIKERIAEIESDGVSFSEVQELSILNQQKALWDIIASGQDINGAAAARLALETQVTNQLQKQKDIMGSMHKSGTTASGDDEYTAQIGEYTYTGKINVIPGKFIGVRTVR